MASNMTERQSPNVLNLEYNPRGSGIADAFLIAGEHAYHVWALIGHYLATGRDVTRLVEDYELSPETATELVRRYETNQENLGVLVDARLKQNADALVA